jgi:agmatine/peptidylarginine deiminase
MAVQTTSERTMTMDDPIEEPRWERQRVAIENHNAPLLAQVVVGRTIVGFEREPDKGDPWCQDVSPVTVTLDDGSRLRFEGWGYDAWGLLIHYDPPT